MGGLWLVRERAGLGRGPPSRRRWHEMGRRQGQARAHQKQAALPKVDSRFYLANAGGIRDLVIESEREGEPQAVGFWIGVVTVWVAKRQLST